MRGLTLTIRKSAKKDSKTLELASAFVTLAASAVAPVVAEAVESTENDSANDSANKDDSNKEFVEYIRSQSQKFEGCRPATASEVAHLAQLVQLDKKREVLAEQAKECRLLTLGEPQRFEHPEALLEAGDKVAEQVAEGKLDGVNAQIEALRDLASKEVLARSYEPLDFSKMTPEEVNKHVLDFCQQWNIVRAHTRVLQDFEVAKSQWENFAVTINRKDREQLCKLFDAEQFIPKKSPHLEMYERYIEQDTELTASA